MSEVVQFERRDGYTVAKVLEAKCIGSTCRDLTAALDRWIGAEQSPRLVIDFQLVQSLDPLFTTWLATTHVSLLSKHVRLAGCGIGPKIRTVLALMISHRILWDEKTAEEASRFTSYD